MNPNQAYFNNFFPTNSNLSNPMQLNFPTNAYPQQNYLYGQTNAFQQQIFPNGQAGVYSQPTELYDKSYYTPQPSLQAFATYSNQEFSKVQNNNYSPSSKNFSNEINKISESKTFLTPKNNYKTPKKKSSHNESESSSSGEETDKIYHSSSKKRKVDENGRLVDSQARATNRYRTKKCLFKKVIFKRI